MINLVTRALDNLTNEYYQNPRLAQLVLVFISIYILISVYFYKKNDKVNIADRDAEPGEFSHGSAYTNISAFKHDFFKQLTIDILPPLVIFGIPSFIYWSMNRYNDDFIPILRFDEIISFATYKDFMNSIIGKSLLSGLGYFAFYHILQPNIINKTPFF